MLEAVLCACRMSGTCSWAIDRARVLVQITHPRDRALRRCSGIFRLFLRRNNAFARPHSKGLGWIGMSVSMWRRLVSVSGMAIPGCVRGRVVKQLQLNRLEGEFALVNAPVCSRSFATAISFEVGRVTLCDDG
jgi:hypothetical protein